MPIAPGIRLGPYEILAPLGAGGMGEVYRARDTRLGRDVAIKVLPEHLSASPEDRARFQREAKAISALNHPHICVLHDIGQERDTQFLVMELVEGETLANRLARGPLATADALRLGAQIADALERAHRAGVVHRDLKPGNVMLTKAGAKLMDFGLARVARPGEWGPGATTATAPGGAPRSGEPITARGTVLGTVQYMAPELLEGRQADARADLWALGCVLYEMVTGRRAFEGSTQASIISGIMRDQPRDVTELAPLTPSALERAVRQCLAKDPDDRWQTAGDLKRELSWLAAAPALAGGPAADTNHQKGGQRIAWIISATFAVIVGILSALLWRVDRTTPERYNFTPLTFKGMTIFAAAFAPDGKTAVYSAATSGHRPRIYAIRPESLEPEAVSDPGTQLLAVSSRGEMAVLIAAKYYMYPIFVGTLARQPLGGGAPREMADQVACADWSPDGSQLAIIRYVGGEARLEFPIGHVLYKKAPGFLANLRVSPRGDQIAFLEHPRLGVTGGSLDVVDLNGHRRVLSSGWRALTGLAWAHDGDEILVSAERAGCSPAVYAVAPSGKVRMALQSTGGLTVRDINMRNDLLMTREDEHDAVMVHKPGWERDRDLSWLDGSQNGVLSADGSVVAFNEQSEGIPGGEVVTCMRKTDGSAVTRLGAGENFEISPDGKWVATVVGGTLDTLVLQPIGAGEPRRLVPGRMKIHGVLWFPGRDSILIQGQETGKNFQLFVQDLRGGSVHPLTPEGYLNAVIARDGSWAMARGAGDCLLYRLNGNPPTPIRWLHAGEQLLRSTPDPRSVLVVDGIGRDVPLHVVRIDIGTGRRSRFLDLDPQGQSGLLECRLSGFTPDCRSYAYDATYLLSTLYLATPLSRRHG